MLSCFQDIVSILYAEWEDCLMPSLLPMDKEYFESIRNKKVDGGELARSLFNLSRFLFRKFKKSVIVLIDEYEAPNNRAYERGYFKEANDFFGREVLPVFLKTNPNLQYAVLVGVTPTAKSGWYSGWNNAESKLKLADLRAQYNSYIAAGDTSVYNPVSVMSALSRTIGLKQFSYDLNVDAVLLTGAEIGFTLMADVAYGSSTLNEPETLTLLYYAGYLTMTTNDQFKIPNHEVMADWARWVIDDVQPWDNILKTCVEGPIGDFVSLWPDYMQQRLDSMLVAKTPGAVSRKIPEKVYRAFFCGLMQYLKSLGWKVKIENRSGEGYIDIGLEHGTKGMGVLIELKSSAKQGDLQKDAIKALKQIEEKNYRNQFGLPNIHTLREYGIAAFHLNSRVEGRYLKLNAQNQWVGGDDPVMSVL